jgi:hypothetical protein
MQPCVFARGNIALKPFMVVKRFSSFQHAKLCGFDIMKGGHHRLAFFFRF